jgi:hypothetical protein
MSVIAVVVAAPVRGVVVLVRAVTTTAAMVARAAMAKAAISMPVMNLSARNGHRAQLARCITRWRMKTGFPLSIARRGLTVIAVLPGQKANAARLRMVIVVPHRRVIAVRLVQRVIAVRRGLKVIVARRGLKAAMAARSAASAAVQAAVFAARHHAANQTSR